MKALLYALNLMHINKVFNLSGEVWLHVCTSPLPKIKTGGFKMYKVISNIDFSVIWSTKDRQEAIAIAKKYQASVYQKDKKILDFS